MCDLLKPNDSMNLVNFGLSRGLVNMLETLSSVSTYFTWILPSSTASWMKWYCRSMCFVLAWNLLSFASAMAPWLLHEMVIFCASKIVNDLFQSFPVSKSRILHELWHYSHHVCCIWPWNDYGTQYTPNCLDIWHSMHPGHLVGRQRALTHWELLVPWASIPALPGPFQTFLPSPQCMLVGW